jgi:hypothetical protein
VSYTSEEDVRYAVQPHDSIDIIPFLGFFPSEAFLKVIYPSIFVVPVDTAKRSSGDRRMLPIWAVVPDY